MPQLTEPYTPTDPPGEMAGVVHRNIRQLAEMRREFDRRKGLADRIADGVSKFAGSMTFVFIHAAVVAAWVAINLGWAGVKPFDPTFVILATAASVEAIFLSTFILISQNRMAVLADRRADLDLQVSLLAEHEVTRLVEMVDAIRQHLGVDVPIHDVDELKQDVAPAKVAAVIEASEARVDA
jgi:uncharacterized membrane protein